MNIHEYQAKQILQKYGIGIPNGSIAYTPQEAKRAAQKVSPRGPWVMKAQIQSGARADGHFLEKKAGRGGGIRLIKSRTDIAIEAEKMIGSTLVTKQTDSKGKLVSKVYIEEFCKCERTFYASLIINRATASIALLIASSTTNILELATQEPEKILYTNLGLNDKITEEQLNKIMAFLNLNANCRNNLQAFINDMHTAFLNLDAIMIEINPVGINKSGELIALDAKISFDDNALFRHQDIAQMRDDYEEDESVLKAAQYGFKYYKHDSGSIGGIVNGSGVALSMADMLNRKGEELACFLNVKGGVDKDKISAGIKLIMTNPRVEGILINILGGFLRCNLVADGIIAAASEVGLNVPLVVRFEGTNKDEARDILTASALPVILADTMEDAVEKLLKTMEEND